LIGRKKSKRKKDGDSFTVCYANDEQTKNFTEEKQVEDTQEKEEKKIKQELEEQIVFKVVRKAVSRFKEKLED